MITTQKLQGYTNIGLNALGWREHFKANSKILLNVKPLKLHKEMIVPSKAKCETLTLIDTKIS